LGRKAYELKEEAGRARQEMSSRENELVKVIEEKDGEVIKFKRDIGESARKLNSEREEFKAFLNERLESEKKKYRMLIKEKQKQLQSMIKTTGHESSRKKIETKKSAKPKNNSRKRK
jgi:vacuolar-type H+-ATPase subunit I/STV1